MTQNYFLHEYSNKIINVGIFITIYNNTIHIINNDHATNKI